MQKKELLLVVAVIVALGLGVLFGRGMKGDGGGGKTASFEGTSSPQPPISSPLMQTGVSPAPNYEEMVRLYKERLAKEPENAELLANLGDVYFEMKSYEDAISYYKQAVRYNPDDVDSLNDLGLSYLYTGKLKEALDFVNRGIKVDPEYQRVWLTKGFVLSRVGRLSEAMTAWQKAHDLGPDTGIGRAASEFLNQAKVQIGMKESIKLDIGAGKKGTVSPGGE